ncbi:fimbria/pilus outer membrane usher protein [Aureimonas populi]|uniref:Fimbria/pilus outer membrane usher protein n=1 Tax=Aureimonas populi TaxID=1701758 RepID=A0ABW5CSJ6_9HYPH|nr:fimbria/pilus outer membrane usher protein [Aureimonas populi]
MFWCDIRSRWSSRAADVRQHDAIGLVLVAILSFGAAPLGGQALAAAMPVDPMDLPVAGAPALDPMDVPYDPMDMPTGAAAELYLEVFVNGTSTRKVVPFTPLPQGGFALAQDELRAVGLLPAEAALGDDGLVHLDRLAEVVAVYDEATQSMHFSAGDAQRVTRVIDASKGPKEEQEPRAAPRSGWGMLMNYSLYASSGDGGIGDIHAFQGASGAFEGRLFSPYGVFEQTFVASAARQDAYRSTRLDTSWTYSDPETMRRYRLGDLITGGLSWTRPARLAGAQVQRNFDLRPDLVTLAVPGLSGSAALPSTVDVFVNGARRFSREIEPGPFRLTNLPVVTGAGTARVVVRDASGQETTSESAFFASSQLLATGLFDYSAEIGFGRTGFGVESMGYDERPMGSGSVRYGLNEGLTLEGHLEGGADLANGGAGIVAAVRSLGTVSLALSGSHSKFGTGYQANASAETQLGAVKLQARAQASFDDYHDIASIIDAAQKADDGLFPLSAGRLKSVAQASATLPLIVDPSSVNVSFTRTETFEGEVANVLGLSYSRSLPRRSTVFASGFADLERGDFGVYAGLNISFGDGYSASSSVTSNGEELVAGLSLARNGGREVGDYGWQIDMSEGGPSARRAARGRYKASAAEMRAGLEQRGGDVRATGQMDGAVVLADRDIFFANTIHDSFAVVDVGVPDVLVEHENRPVGRTGKGGKLLVPGLRSYEDNRISIDPRDLPLDTGLDSTREIVTPADRSGVVVTFGGAAASASALVSFRDEAGNPIELGATGHMGDAAFMIGYDGEAYLENLAPTNSVTIERLDGRRCLAQFPYSPQGGAQVSIRGVTCTARA